MQQTCSEATPGGNGDNGRRPFLVLSVSPAMAAMEQAIATVARTSVPVLIVGEMGAGKRTLGYRLHEMSPRKQQGVEELNCAELSVEPLRLHVAAKGSGASCGTLLLTEITEIPAACQTVLLEEVIEQEKNGNAGPRLIASTSRDLEQEMRSGHFREDLYYRLSGVCLRIPPLRHRREDIPLLADHFLRRYSTLFGRPEPALSPNLRRFLNEYAWPGNIGELEAAMRTLAAVGDERIAIAALRSGSMQGGRNGEVESTSLKDASRAASRQAERELILRVLSRTRWNRKRAAEELRISYKALLYKLKQIGVDDYAKSLAQGDDV